MDSDVISSPLDTDSYVQIVTVRQVSCSVVVSRLNSGDYAMAVRNDDSRVILHLTPEEMRDFSARLSRFAGTG